MASYTVAVEKVKGSPAPLDAAEKAHHHKNGKKIFNNPWPSWREMDPEAVKAHLKSRNWLASWTHSSTAELKIPVVEPVFFTERLGKDASNLRATWLGHACFLVEFPSGLRALFDPVMTDRCSPFSWAGPKRFTRAPCEIKDIPVVDIVVISHNHYDHLSHPSIMELHKSQPKAHFFVPLGNEGWFRSCGIQNITELDWWEEADFSLSLGQGDADAKTISARVSCLPAQHNSGRSLFDTDKTLWASWGVKSPRPSFDLSANVASVFFGGDTGYRSVPTLSNQSDDWNEAYKDLPVCPAFSEIGRLHGPFSLGLLPIGAYEPRALMAPVHGNPRDAVEIFRDTGCKRALAMHWGTWVMGDEHIGEPPKKLAEALTARALPEKGVFDVCNAGESVLIPI